MTKISGVVIAFNEEARIGACLASLNEVCDEIIVLDSYSTDKTFEISQKAGARVFKEIWKGFAATKNLANAHANFPYILSLDADEVLSPALIQSILKEKDKLHGAYKFSRLNFYRGMPVKYCGWYPDIKIRLFPTKQSTWEGEFVHEKLSLANNMTIQKLKGDLWHYTIQSREEHLKTVTKYADLAAKEYLSNHKRTHYLKPYLSYLAMFVKKYLLQFGILEGGNGLLISHYSALSRYLKYKKVLLNQKK